MMNGNSNIKKESLFIFARFQASATVYLSYAIF